MLLSVRAWGMSCGDLVLVCVCKSAEDLFPADPVLGEVDLRWPGAGLSRRELAEGTVRPGSVLIAQHQEFGILGHLTPGQHHQAAQQTARKHVGDGEDHSAMIPKPRLLLRPCQIE